MAAVEDIARHRGVAVHWFNPPLKRLPRGNTQ
jgi:hypothetical protein